MTFFFFLPGCSVVAGVLETESEEDRDAIRKAKALYSSCMNESEALLIWLEHLCPIYIAQDLVTFVNDCAETEVFVCVCVCVLQAS